MTRFDLCNNRDGENQSERRKGSFLLTRARTIYPNVPALVVNDSLPPTNAWRRAMFSSVPSIPRAAGPKQAWYKAAGRFPRPEPPPAVGESTDLPSNNRLLREAPLPSGLRQ